MTELNFYITPPLWAIALFVLPLLGLLAYLAYRLHSPNLFRRRVLFSLRLCLFFLALLILLGPYWEHSQTETTPATLVILADDSSSMQRMDAIPIDSNSPPTTRNKALLSILESSDFKQLSSRYELKSYRINQTLEASPLDSATLQANGTTSGLGQSLQDLIHEFRGQGMPDVVLMSDGRSNEGISLQQAAAMIHAEGARVHTVSFGEPSTSPDLQLEAIRLPGQLIVGDDFSVSLRLLSKGSPLPAQSQIKLVDESGNVLDSLTLSTPKDQSEVITLRSRIHQNGPQVLRALVEAAPGETDLQNNQLVIPIHPQELHIRVLYVDGSPRWEYRYLKNRLLRADKDLDVHVWLASAVHDFPQEHSAGISSLKSLPTEAKDLLDNWDVILLGDIRPHDLDPDPSVGPRFIDAVAEFVKLGGGLFVLSGPTEPPALIDTALAPLLPVQLSNTASPVSTLGFSALPPSTGAPHPTVLLDSNPAKNLQLWQRNVPLYWSRPVDRLKPGARTWLQRTLPDGTETPIAASHSVPKGWVGWLGTDETWRWRFPGGEIHLERFWRSALRHLAATRLRGLNGRAQLSVDPKRGEIGSFITLEAQIKDENWQPLQDADGIPVFSEDELVCVLHALPHEPGTFRGRLPLHEAKTTEYRITTGQTAAHPTLASTFATGVFSSRESLDTSADIRALKELSHITDGLAVSSQEIGKLFQRLDGRERFTRVLSREEQPPSPWPLLIACLLIAATEWILRRRWHLC